MDEIDTLDEVVSDLTLKVKAADQLQMVAYVAPRSGMICFGCVPEASAPEDTLALLFSGCFRAC